MIASAAALVIGSLIGFFAPSEAVLGASAELIAFITLIMAGLLPAMILTATAIRGDAFSTVRVREYGDGLRRQLQFWAVLFLASLITGYPKELHGFSLRINRYSNLHNLYN